MAKNNTLNNQYLASENIARDAIGYKSGLNGCSNFYYSHTSGQIYNDAKNGGSSYGIKQISSNQFYFNNPKKIYGTNYNFKTNYTCHIVSEYAYNRGDSVSVSGTSHPRYKVERFKIVN